MNFISSLNGFTIAIFRMVLSASFWDITHIPIMVVLFLVDYVTQIHTNLMIKGNPVVEEFVPLSSRRQICIESIYINFKMGCCKYQL